MITYEDLEGMTPDQTFALGEYMGIALRFMREDPGHALVSHPEYNEAYTRACELGVPRSLILKAYEDAMAHA